MERWKSERYRRQVEKLLDGEFVSPEFFENKSILITGATGLLGMALCDFFLFFIEKYNVNISVSIMVRNVNDAKNVFEEHIKTGKFKMVEHDLLTPFQGEDEWDYMLHGAGNNHPLLFSEQPVETMKIGLLGTISLLEHAKQQKRRLEKFVFFSSGEVYGEQMYQHSDGCGEELPGIVDSMALRSCYTESKRACETLCVSYYHEYNIPAVVARLGYVYGPTMQKKSSKADIQFFRDALEGKSICLKSTGEQTRSYVYIMDALAGILIVLCKGQLGEAYNIANSDSNVKIKELAMEIADTAGVGLSFEIPNEKESRGYSRLKSEILTTSKIAELGYRPCYNLSKGVEDTYFITKEFWDGKRNE